jgi:predicted MFS family arabinose efflux permease
MSSIAPTKTIALLSASQAVVGSQAALIMSVGALVGISLAPDPTLATVPITSMVVGTAITAAPATFLIHKIGRKKAFIFGTSLAIISGLIAAIGIFLASFIIFCIGLLFGGASAAFGQQYRFAAADSVPNEKKGSAISWVMAGGVIAGFVGPFMSRTGRDWFEGAEFAGSFLALSGIALLGIVILSQTNLPKAVDDEAMKGEKTPFSKLIRSPDIFIPMVSGIVTYSLMTFIMVAAPLAMVVACGHSKDQATTAIQWHIISMFAPSFFTAFIITKIGARAMTGVGLALILGSVLISLNGISINHFNFAMILLGVGWNFGFIGSTALLTQGYRPQDAVRVQALNEQLVFGTMAIASIASGVLLQTVGWQAVNVFAIPVITITLALLAYGDYYHSKKTAY